MTETRLDIAVYGRPAPQGSKRLLAHGAVVEQSRHVKPWRADVVAATRDAIDEWEIANRTSWPMVPTTWHVSIVFRLARPRHHYRTGAHADELRPNAPAWVGTVPDLDKMVRSTIDAIVTAGAIPDDRYVASLHAVKRHIDHGDTPGATIHLRPITGSAVMTA